MSEMTRRPSTAAVPPWSLAVGAMFTIQLSAALSVPLIGSVGAAGTAWLRLTAGALVLLIVIRPPLRSIRRSDLPSLLGLGVATGLMSICFLAAIDKIPLGTAVAIEFLGPLTVAAIRSRSRRALIWPGWPCSAWSAHRALDRSDRSDRCRARRYRRCRLGRLHPAHPTRR